MRKKICIFLLIFTLCFLCGCSQESKFGLEQFSHRMSKEYEIDFNTADFMYGQNENGENYLFYEEDNFLLSLSLDANNSIKGVSLLCTESMDINSGLDTFCKICSVFTGESYENQKSTLEECKINTDEIKYADDSFSTTVGKYKYSVVCNNYSITLFCDRV